MLQKMTDNINDFSVQDREFIQSIEERLMKIHLGVIEATIKIERKKSQNQLEPADSDFYDRIFGETVRVNVAKRLQGM